MTELGKIDGPAWPLPPLHCRTQTAGQASTLAAMSLSH